jgi:hypothetical protein
MAARCWRLRYDDIGEALALLATQARDPALHRRLSA